MEKTELRQSLAGGLFISSMMGITDGRWVAERADHTQMVQIGALIADTADRSHDARYLLPAEEEAMVPVFEAEISPIRERWGALPICLNAAPGDLESAIRMAHAFERAGGDIYELNCHGTYARLLEKGLLRDMVLPANRDTMHTWLVALCELSIPVVVKFNGTMEGIDFSVVLDGIADIPGLFGVHLNIRDMSSGLPNLALARQVRPHVGGVFWCSGHVRSAEQVAELRAVGADSIGVSQGLRDEPTIFARLTAET